MMLAVEQETQKQAVGTKRKRRQEQVEEVQQEQIEEQLEESVETEQIQTKQVERPQIKEIEFGSVKKRTLKSLANARHTHLMNAIAKTLQIETVEDLLRCPIEDIQREVDFPIEQIQALVTEVSLQLTPTKISALHLLTDSKLAHKQLSLGCSHLDELLGGGIMSKTITEIVGESSSGKTQFCLQLALQCVLDESQGGLGGKVLYLHTEDFPFSRFFQMAENFGAKHGCSTDKFANCIFPERIVDVEQLWFKLNREIVMMLNSKDNNIKLIVLDSIAAILRTEYET